MSSIEKSEVMVPRPSAAPLKVTSWYRHYTLIMLAFVYASSMMDRQITAILIDDLKIEFVLSDTQLGLLSGLAFALLYATLGIPIARLADRSNRTLIISISMTVWGLMTAISGASQNFIQLVLARVGVGVGEAGSSPPSHSIISDYYEPRDRPMAMSVWALGAILGSIVGLVGGGYIAEHYGWRWAFFAAGAQSLILVPIFYLTVREPERGQSDVRPVFETESVSGGSSFSIILELLRNPLYLLANMCHVLAAFFTYGLSAWLPVYLMRSFDIGQTEVGGILAVILLSAGIAGMLLGGWLVSILAKRDAGWEAWVPAVALAISVPCSFLALMSNSLLLASVGFGAALFFAYIHHGPGLALVQSSVPANRRSMATALMFFCSNMLGLGLGPLAIGFISDLGLADSPGGNLGVGLSFAIIPMIVGAIGYWRLGHLWRMRSGAISMSESELAVG